jgi:hypothetical protein
LQHDLFAQVAADVIISEFFQVMEFVKHDDDPSLAFGGEKFEEIEKFRKEALRAVFIYFP